MRNSILKKLMLCAALVSLLLAISVSVSAETAKLVLRRTSSITSTRRASTTTISAFKIMAMSVSRFPTLSITTLLSSVR